MFVNQYPPKQIKQLVKLLKSMDFIVKDQFEYDFKGFIIDQGTKGLRSSLHLINLDLGMCRDLKYGQFAKKLNSHGWYFDFSEDANDENDEDFVARYPQFYRIDDTLALSKSIEDLKENLQYYRQYEASYNLIKPLNELLIRELKKFHQTIEDNQTKYSELAHLCIDNYDYEDIEQDLKDDLEAHKRLVETSLRIIKNCDHKQYELIILLEGIPTFHLDNKEK